APERSGAPSRASALLRTPPRAFMRLRVRAESTAQFARPDFQGRQPGGPAPQRPAPPQQRQSPESTGQFPRPPAPQQRTEPEALPPAQGPGDGRTPLFDTLESDWFRGIRGGEDGGPQDNGRQTPSSPGNPPPQRREPARTAGGGTNGNGTAQWRTSPNDELGRQAERVRQPAAGGVTTSGLPRRVPRANLVAGTAQQEPVQPAGPQVSRAPDDVRGRLTNLRRGIQRGRQAGSSPAGGGHGIGPTHHQER
ncbi:histidine kinase, partial [Streptomyces sp. NPDC048845]